MPSPGNPQALNRYTYAVSNPVRYTDPSGHFTEKQLVDWFGKNWRDLFDTSWITILLAAELGDALLYNMNGDFPLTAIFVLDGGELVGWDLGVGHFTDRKVTDLMSLKQKSDSDVLALFRSPNANLEGGPSRFPGEDINLYHATREYVHVNGDTARSSITLPEDWYVGPQDSVYAHGYFAGLDLGLSDILDLGKKGFEAVGAYLAAKKLGQAVGSKVFEVTGGWAGLAMLAVDVAEWTRWDTTYSVSPSANLPPQAIPTPPRW